MPQVQFRHVLLAVAACLVAGVSVQLWIEHTVARRALLERRRIPYWEFPPKFELQTQSHTRMHAVTCIHYTTEDEVIFTSQFNHKSAKGKPSPTRSDPFPVDFYSGAVYAVSAWHQRNKVQSSKANYQQNLDLLDEINHMYPKPKLVVPYSSIDRETDFYERGYALHFDFVTREVELAVLALGRVFGQVQVTKWWGHAWGSHPRDHVTLVQSLVPVATAVWGVKAQAPIRLVYPHKEEQKFFDDHWKKPTRDHPSDEL